MSRLDEGYFADAKSYRDPVHGDIRLYRYETQIINTRAFQRLRGVKQLAACELVWAGATHTRFQHSIGTLGMAQRICDSLKERHWEISTADLVVIRLFALLHDIGHIPFGHTIEDERPVIAERHDDDARIRRIIAGEIENQLVQVEQLLTDEERRDIGIAPKQGSSKKPRLQNLTDLIAFLITAAKGETAASLTGVRDPWHKKHHFFLDIVGNTVCADLFDYLARDTYFTGLRRSYDEKIFSHLVLWKDRLAVDLGEPRYAEDASQTGVRTRGGIITEITNLLRVRYTLAERVYFNDAKTFASAMVSQAVQSVGVDLESLSTMRDDELLCYLENTDQCPVHDADASTFEKKQVPVREDRRVFADVFGEQITSLWEHIANWRPREGSAAALARQIIESYRRRNILRPIYTITPDVTDGRKRSLLCKYLHDVENKDFRMLLEHWLAEMCSLEPWQVIIYCPAQQMNEKVVRTPIGPLPGGIYKDMCSLSDEDTSGSHALRMLMKEVDNIKGLHSNLWSMEVLVDEEVDRQKKGFLNACSSQLFAQQNALATDIYSEVQFPDVLRHNLREACQILGIDPNINLEDRLLRQRARGGNILCTTAEFLEEMKALPSQGTLLD